MMNYQRALYWYDMVVTRLRGVPHVEESYRLVDEALRELIDFKLMTVQRVTTDGKFLERLYTSDPRFPLGGHKPFTDDAWLTSLLAEGEPVITSGSAAVKAAFRDHEAIFALGCGAVLNVPITAPSGTLGSLNLLNIEGWFTRDHVLAAQPFCPLLALFWQSARV
jgi:hypothetical protein